MNFKGILWVLSYVRWGPWSKVLPAKLRGPQLGRYSPHFVETGGSGPHWKEIATRPAPILNQIDQSIPHPISWRYIGIFLSQLRISHGLSLSLTFLLQKPVRNSLIPHTCHMTRPSQNPSSTLLPLIWGTKFQTHTYERINYNSLSLNLSICAVNEEQT